MSKRLRQILSPTRFSAAEAVLGIVCLVLVIWLFWPESQSPKIDQRAAWQQQLNDAGRRQANQALAVQSTRKVEAPIDIVEDAIVIAPKVDRERRTLAMPSELADRVDNRRPTKPVAMPVPRRETFETARSRAVAQSSVAIDQSDQTEIGATATPPSDTSQVGENASETVTAAVEEQLAPDEPAEQTSDDLIDVQEPEIKVATYSSEALDLLSELDNAADEGDAAPIATLPQKDGFEIESSSSTHVRQRPRDDAPSWLRHAVTASLIDDRPVIAIVIDDLGLNRPKTKALNTLAAPLTLAFLPYAGNVEAQAAAARDAGHELLVHLPMEPLGSAWPGPDALITSLEHDEFVKRLETNLDRIDGYVGVNNHMGSRLTADRGRMDLVMRELRKRDVLFLDSKTNSRSIAGEMASRNGVPNTTRDVFLDHVIDIDKIRSQFSRVERIARLTGSAVAIGHPHSATIEALREWLPKLAERGFALAPLSAVIARRACRDELLIAPETCGRYLYAQTPASPPITAEGG